MPDEARPWPRWVRWSRVFKYPNREAAVTNQGHLVKAFTFVGAIGSIKFGYFFVHLGNRSPWWIAGVAAVAVMGLSALWQGRAIRWMDREQQWGRRPPAATGHGTPG